MSESLHAEELWWKNAVVYCLDVETYMDADGDGVGDFKGLTRRLDHLASLGVTCLWLLPFYPATGDDGYAITDFYAVDPRLGTLGDFVTFRRAAGDRGIRVIVDLVVNHTSDCHPWFVESRSSRTSSKRDWYVWSDEPIPQAEHEVFPGEQHGNWQLDEATLEHYFHRFHDFQPDLNLSNVEVRLELLQIMGFWLELGVDGFRLDAAPYVIETHGVEGPAGEHHHEWLREMHEFITHRRGDAVLLGEANLDPDEMVEYFGDGAEMQLLFSYAQNAALIAALAVESAAPLRDHLGKLPVAPVSCGWLNFVRLHDELNLERLDVGLREQVFERFAPDERTRVYGRGIRRRISPMLCDRRRIELAYSLAFSTPGMPLLLYGDEIGMGDELDLPGRLSVRTPMQWDGGPNAGFSPAPPEDLVRPVVAGDVYGPASVNVADQRHDAGSLLHWFQQLIDVRRRHPVIGLGKPDMLDTGHDDVFGHCCTWNGDIMISLHNLGPQPRAVDLRRVPVDGPVAVVFADGGRVGALDDHTVELGPYGYRWLRGQPSAKHEDAVAAGVGRTRA